MSGGGGPPVTVRAADRADYPVLASIWRGAWASANPGAAHVESVRHWWERAERESRPPNNTVLAIVGDDIVAFYVVAPAHRYLHELHVRPEVQGRGVGSMVLQRIKASFGRGFSLHVAAGNMRAQSFYQRHGLLRRSESRHPESRRPRVEYVHIGSERSSSAAA